MSESARRSEHSFYDANREDDVQDSGNHPDSLRPGNGGKPPESDVTSLSQSSTTKGEAKSPSAPSKEKYRLMLKAGSIIGKMMKGSSADDLVANYRALCEQRDEYHYTMLEMPRKLDYKRLEEQFRQVDAKSSFDRTLRALIEEFGVVFHQLHETDAGRRKAEKDADHSYNQYQNMVRLRQSDYQESAGKIRKLQEELESTALERAQESSRHEEDVRNLKDNYSKQLYRLNQENNAKLQYQKISHDEAMAMRTSKFERQLEARDADVNNLRHDLQKQQDRHAAEISKLRTEISMIKTQHRDELQNQQEKHAVEMKQKQKNLRKDIAALHGALVARDHFKGLSDHEVLSKFGEIDTDLDWLSRLNWTKTSSVWPDTLLDRTSKNPRKMKKNILKHTMWTIFFQHIFNSPFRIFGPAGQELETKWNRAHGEGLQTGGKDSYSWPKASLEAERWRFEIMKEAKDTVNQDISELDSRYKVKQGYESSLRLVKDRLFNVLNGYGELDTQVKTIIQEVTLKAFRTWIDFGNQRYRIMILLPEGFPNDMPTVVQQFTDREQSIELLVAPEIKRFGTADGRDYDPVVTIGPPRLEKIATK